MSANNGGKWYHRHKAGNRRVYQNKYDIPLTITVYPGSHILANMDEKRTIKAKA
jgi:hypothetical protein